MHFDKETISVFFLFVFFVFFLGGWRRDGGGGCGRLRVAGVVIKVLSGHETEAQTEKKEICKCKSYHS